MARTVRRKNVNKSGTIFKRQSDHRFHSDALEPKRSWNTSMKAINKRVSRCQDRKLCHDLKLDPEADHSTVPFHKHTTTWDWDYD